MLGRVVFVAGLLLLTAPAFADETEPTPERIKAAAEEFDLGRRAYLAKDYEQAAGHFENAFRDAPSKETLRLAIRARRDGKQAARAATLAALAQEKYGADAPTAALAKETLSELSRALAEYVVTCDAPCAVAADGRVVSQAEGVSHRLFLDPGPHHLGVSFAQRGSVAKEVDAEKGTATTLAFEMPPAPSSPPVARIDLPKAEPRPRKAFGPVVFVAAAGVTLLAGAATVVSGIATENDPGAEAVRRQCAGKGESCPLYVDGQDAETRTNILLGATIGAAAITAAIGLFFTDWPRPARAARWRARPLGLGATF